MTLPGILSPLIFPDSIDAWRERRDRSLLISLLVVLIPAVVAVVIAVVVAVVVVVVIGFSKVFSNELSWLSVMKLTSTNSTTINTNATKTIGFNFTIWLDYLH